MIVRWQSGRVNTREHLLPVCDKPYHTNKRNVQTGEINKKLRKCALFSLNCLPARNEFSTVEYSPVMEIWSRTGTTTPRGFLVSWRKSGCSQPMFTSHLILIKSRTWPWANFAAVLYEAILPESMRHEKRLYRNVFYEQIAV